MNCWSTKNQACREYILVFKKRENYKPVFEKLKEKLFDLNESFESLGLNINNAHQFIEKRLAKAQEYLDSMDEVIASAYIQLSEILPAAREMLASIGESHTAYNSAEILKSKGYNAMCIDLSGWGDHRTLTINERIEDTFSKIDYSKKVVFATGYVKGTEGIMREFDRGYSEITFSKVAVFLKASEAIIHKEFHLCSADPKMVGEKAAKPVGKTNFDVADQLADVGMEAIHPKASKPLEKQEIPLRVKNAFDPDHPGTLITKDYISPDSRTEIVAGSNKVVAVEIHDTSMVGEVGFDKKIMEVFEKYNISYIGKSTNANSICTIVMENSLPENFQEILNSQFELVTILRVAIVCAIGSNIAKPGVLAKAAGALANSNINIIAVMQTTRQTNMQFIVAREQYEIAVKALHQSLCD